MESEKPIDNNQNENKYQFAIRASLRIGFIALLILLSFLILKPFIMIVAWGIIIAVGIYPFFRKFTKVLGGRKKLATTLITLLLLAVVIVPSLLFTTGTVDSMQTLAADFKKGSLIIPLPPDKVADWPVVGGPIYEIWELSATNLEAALIKMKPQIQEYGPKIVGSIASLGFTVLQLILAIIIAGALLLNAKAGARATDNIFKLLAGDDGEAFTNIAQGTISSVVQGVLGVAIIQAIAAGIGLLLVGMPGAGIWVLLVLMLAIMQLPPAIILIPISIYVFTITETTPAVIFLVWSIIVSISDTFLKPMLLGRGVDVPMLVILLGAIGGMMLSGIIGLFVGAVVLAITYKVFGAVIKRSENKPEPAKSSAG